MTSSFILGLRQIVLPGGASALREHRGCLAGWCELRVSEGCVSTGAAAYEPCEVCGVEAVRGMRRMSRVGYMAYEPCGVYGGEPYGV